jgi:thioesterase domain-containing protein
VRPSGPYHLVGWSFGGLVAQAVATGLQATGERVGLLAALDAYPPDGPRTGPAGQQDALGQILESLGCPVPDTPLSPPVFLEALARAGSPVAGLDESRVAAMADVFAGSLALASGFTPEKFHGDLALFRAAADKAEGAAVPSAWSEFVTGQVQVTEIDCRHGEIIAPGPIAVVGAELAALLRTGANPMAEQGEHG